ncbi:MAG TPA: triose-phosphate isomerase [Rhodocyclaceae bacterium]|nr:triose-phosphate isomerase [Rhodocyclaceae bacterium]
MGNKLVIGNWKSNGRRLENEALLGALRAHSSSAVSVVVCVPYPYLDQAGRLLQGSAVAFGAQNVSGHPDGAFTGEVSAGMLADCGCSYVIVGHSERRALLGETDEDVARKAALVLRSGLVPVVCVGETLAERDAGEVERVIARQLDAVCAAFEIEELARIVVAYEPVWAIGTGRSADVSQVQAVLAFVRTCLAARHAAAARARVLYGGSVKASSALALFGLPDCDGGLIGGASLVAEEFLAICEAAVVASKGDSVNE